MAYANKELKATVAAQLKTIMPKEWKYSLAIRHLSTLVLTISKAPVDLTKVCPKGINTFYLKESLTDQQYLPLFTKIIAAMNTDNYRDADVYRDYVDVGHYIDVSIGKWDKPFQYTGTNVEDVSVL